MSFCTTLRRRPSCGSLVATILSPPPSGLSLRESLLQTHDLRLTDPKSKRRFRFLILTASAVAEAKLEHTKSRLQHFMSLTGGTDCAILFPLFDAALPHQHSASHTFASSRGAVGAAQSASTHPDAPPPSTSPDLLPAFSQLQHLLLTLSLSVPILPLAPAPSSLPRLISTFTSALLQASQTAPAHPAIPSAYADILPHCTANPPMSRDMQLRLSDRFACLSDLAGLSARGVEADVERLIEDGAGADEAWAAVEFWERDFVVD